MSVFSEVKKTIAIDKHVDYYGHWSFFDNKKFYFRSMVKFFDYFILLLGPLVVSQNKT